jgi:hypothetical protein
MKDYKKAIYYMAKTQALSNAAEFIRSHGEEGFSFNDEDLEKQYYKAKTELANQLDKRADIFKKKYDQLGIDVDTSIDEGY